MLNLLSINISVAIKLLMLSVVVVAGAEEQEKDYVGALISRCGYPHETHRNIQTEDGYLLTMQRIPGTGSTKENEDGGRKTPVLLMHGLLGSAEHFVLLNCTASLGFMLADAGYDVWLGNVRTVSYSRHHVTLDPNSRDYWQITMDEFGTYDLPALIDYILLTTRREQLMYIGHSQGNMVYYIMCSNKPEYAEKVQLFVNLSPVAALDHFPHPWIPSVCANVDSLQNFVERFGLYEWTLGRDYVREYGGMMCGMMMGVCKYIVYFFSGLPPARLSNDNFQRLLTNCPEGIAAKQFVHGCQMINGAGFGKYDYGAEENLIRYGTNEPPKYNLSATTTPTAIYFCKNDWFLSDGEVLKFVKKIPNVVDLYEITVDGFSHFDFIVSDLAPQHLFPRIINVMNKFRNKEEARLTRSRVSNRDLKKP